MACSKYSILIEGNIASGKSTVIKLLEKKLENRAQTFIEPLSEWTNFCGENLLQKMYEDPTTNSFMFQTFVQYTMAKIQFEETPDKIKITERSLMSERYVFIEAIRTLNFISPIQYEILNVWYQFLVNKTPIVNEVIYLQTTPLIALGRLRGRNRTEEDTVSKEYLELLHTLHENWLIKRRQGDLPFKLTIINQDLPLKEIEKELDIIVDRLKKL